MDDGNSIDINFETILPVSEPLTYKNFVDPLGSITNYLKSSLLFGNDATTDVIIQCSDGVVQLHRLVLAHFSEMFLTIFEEDTKNEPSVVLMMDFTSKNIFKYFEDLLKNGFLNRKDLALEMALAIKKEFIEDFKSENFNGVPDYEDFIDVPAVKNEDLEEVSNSRNEDLHKVPTLKRENLNIKVEDPPLLKPMKKSRKNIEERRKMKNSTWYYFQKDEDNPKELKCKLCAYVHKCPPSCKHISYLNDHIRDKHTDLFLTLDIQRVRGSREPKSKLSKYYTDVPDDLSYRFKICTICNSKIGRNNIIRHIQSVHKKYDEKDAKPQMCSFCGKEFLYTWERDSHINGHRKQFKKGAKFMQK